MDERAAERRFSHYLFNTTYYLHTVDLNITVCGEL